jgi:hypothetical protein
VKLVVPELILNGVPDGVGVGLGGAHDRSDILGHGVIELAQDALVDHGPIWITVVGGGRSGGEVGAEAEFDDEGVEEASPLSVIRLGEIELDGNVGSDVHCLGHGGGGSLDDGLGVGGALD